MRQFVAQILQDVFRRRMRAVADEAESQFVHAPIFAEPLAARLLPARQHEKCRVTVSRSHRATAVQHINTCVPSCADANYRNDRVQMSFSRVRRTSTHRLVFTRVRVTVIKTRKADTFALPLG